MSLVGARPRPARISTPVPATHAPFSVSVSITHGSAPLWICCCRLEISPDGIPIRVCPFSGTTCRIMIAYFLLSYRLWRVRPMRTIPFQPCISPVRGDVATFSLLDPIVTFVQFSWSGDIIHDTLSPSTVPLIYRLSFSFSHTFCAVAGNPTCSTRALDPIPFLFYAFFKFRSQYSL